MIKPLHPSINPSWNFGEGRCISFWATGAPESTIKKSKKNKQNIGNIALPASLPSGLKSREHHPVPRLCAWLTWMTCYNVHQLPTLSYYLHIYTYLAYTYFTLDKTSAIEPLSDGNYRLLESSNAGSRRHNCSWSRLESTPNDGVMLALTSPRKPSRTNVSVHTTSWTCQYTHRTVRRIRIHSWTLIR